MCFGKQEAESPSQEVALLLHRKGFDCSSDPKMPLQCTWSEHEEVTEITRCLRFSEIVKTSFEGFYVHLYVREFVFICLMFLD